VLGTDISMLSCLHLLKLELVNAQGLWLKMRRARESAEAAFRWVCLDWVDQTLKLFVSDGFAKAASRSFACRMASTRAACRTCSLSSAFIEHQRYFVLLSHQQRSVKQHCSCCLKRSKWFCYFDDDQGRYAMLLLPNIP